MGDISMEKQSVQTTALPQIYLTDGKNYYSFENIDKIIPERANQLLAFNIKEKIENILQQPEFNDKIPMMKRIIIICENGIPKEAKAELKEGSKR